MKKSLSDERLFLRLGKLTYPSAPQERPRSRLRAGAPAGNSLSGAAAPPSSTEEGRG